MLNPLKTILRGVGQVMLQNNALTGLLFLIGIFFNSWLLGLGAILGNMVSTVFAGLLKYPKDDIENGLYGFNGTLVGIAVWFFFEVSITTTLAIIIFSALSTLIMHLMKKRLPALTAPFVISTWIAMIGIKIFNLVPFLTSALLPTNSLDLFSATSMGFGQVMFQGNIVTGLIFLLAILVNSRSAAIYAIYGSLLGGLLALLFSFPLAMVNIGLFGYNAVLCGIALGAKKWNAFFFATLAIVLSVFLNYSLNKVSVITLTAPFVIATWATLLIKNRIKKIIKYEIHHHW
jgi:urea transporter